jgi:two-component system LytT family response regulator
MKLHVLIADDERLARERLCQFLQAEPEIEIVGECSNGRETVDAIQESSPDVIFLDVRMPELDAFGVIGAVRAEHLPVIVFVTAHDQFALRAFEAHAADYLLKPFTRERFQTALRRARAIVQGKRKHQTIDQVIGLVENLKGFPKPLERLAVKTSGRVLLVKVTEIDWIRGADNYAELHVGKSMHLLRQTVADLERQLPSNQFLRISRSLIVNLNRIKEFRSKSHGDCLVVLHDHTQLPVSRKYRGKLDEVMGR